jgi:hypothetical protein
VELVLEEVMALAQEQVLVVEQVQAQVLVEEQVQAMAMELV